MADSGGGGIDILMWLHAIRMVTTSSVEVCSLAVSKVMGYVNILSAARMNNVIVMVRHTVEPANKLVARGVAIDCVLLNVLPLATPSKKIILSNVPPFIKDYILKKILSLW